jgi:peptide/nickel transport system permease protein
MRTYIIRRLLQVIPVFIGIIFILFFILEQAPGGPLAMLQDPRITPEQKEMLAARLGLDLPFHIKFLNWLGELLRGNLGYSITHKQPVTVVIGNFIGPTFILSLTSLCVAVLIGIPIGVLSAVKQHSWIDNLFTVFALVGISLPSFFFGLLLLKAFAIDIPIFPLFGFQNPMLRNADFWTRFIDKARHLVLPSTVLGLSGAASFMRYTRSAMLEVIRSEYIRTARAEGVRESIVIFRHAFRNALIPVITLLGFWIPGLVSGAVITENVFAFPGLGKIAMDAIMQRNYPLILGINAMLTILTLIAAILTDIAYAAVDPRIRYD